MSKVYYAVREIEEGICVEDFTKNVPINVINHINNKYNETQRVVSLYAYSLLIENFISVYNEIPTIEFNKNKPIIKGYGVSISHSKNAVAVCFSTKENIGIDIEFIKEELPKSLEKKLNKKGVEGFLTFTQLESTYKALNKEFFKGKFMGESSVCKFKGDSYSLSIYYDKNNLELVRL